MICLLKRVTTLNKGNEAVKRKIFPLQQWELELIQKQVWGALPAYKARPSAGCFSSSKAYSRGLEREGTSYSRGRREKRRGGRG
jgi:hypothetical protein